MSTLRELKYNLDKISESSGQVYWQNSSQPLNAVYFQSAPGFKKLVWAPSTTIEITNGSYDVDVGALLSTNNDIVDGANVTILVKSTSIVGKLKFTPVTNKPNLTITFENYGHVQGTRGTSGYNGGTAVEISTTIKLINNGIFSGGGGCGGRGGDGADTTYKAAVSVPTTYTNWAPVSQGSTGSNTLGYTCGGTEVSDLRVTTFSQADSFWIFNFSAVFLNWEKLYCGTKTTAQRDFPTSLWTRNGIEYTARFHNFNLNTTQSIYSRTPIPGYTIPAVNVVSGGSGGTGGPGAGFGFAKINGSAGTAGTWNSDSSEKSGTGGTGGNGGNFGESGGYGSSGTLTSKSSSTDLNAYINSGRSLGGAAIIGKNYLLLGSTTGTCNGVIA